MHGSQRSNPRGGPARLLLLSLAIAAPLLLTSAAAAAPDMERAKQLFAEGAELYDKGEYDKALAKFKASYKESGRPELLYNMGRCQEGMGDLQVAIDSYEAYLLGEPDNAAEVKALVARLKNRIKFRKGKAKPKAPAPKPAPPPPRARPLRLPGWILVGVGAAGLVAGGVLGGMAMAKTGEVEDGYENSTMTYPEYQDAVDQGEGLELGAIIALAVGGAAAATGATLLILDVMGGEGEASGAWLSPPVTADGALVSAGVRF